MSYMLLNIHVLCQGYFLKFNAKNVDNMQKVRYQHHNSICELTGLMIRPVYADDQWDPAEVLVYST